MFTGIIEQLGRIKDIQHHEGKLILQVEATFMNELRVDQSVAHNGICLTLTDINENRYTVCAVHETMAKTTIGSWQKDDLINLERGLIVGSRLDGHIVQGHVDTTGICIERIEANGNWQFRFSYPKEFAALIIEKGSIVINGVSLTCYNLSENTFEVTIIPFTMDHTTFQQLQIGNQVNLEFDVLGKYFLRQQAVKT